MSLNCDYPPEFAALILAARSGARLYPLTSQSHPKHLLPVAGIALILRQLHVLVACHFSDCVIAVASEDSSTIACLKAENDVQQQSTSCFTFKGSLKITLHQLPEDCSGSMQALRDIEENSIFAPSSHVVVIPGDLVITDKLVLEQFANAHRQGCMDSTKTACSMLLADLGEQDENGIPLKESAKAKKNGLSRDEDQIEYIALSIEQNSAPRVVWKQSKIDLEDDEDMVGTSPKLVLPKARLRGGYLTRVRTDFHDVHLYILSPWVRQLCRARPSFVSIKGDLIPLLVESQFQGVESAFGDQEDAKMVYQQSFPTDTNGEDAVENVAKDAHVFAVRAQVVSASSAMRACTVPAYLVACREIVTLGLADTRTGVNPCLVFPTGAVLNAKFNSVILKEAEIGEKNLIKSSVLGSGTVLGAKCKLNNVVVMSYAAIGDNVILQNAVLGEGCKIGDNCSLSYVRVGPGKVIPPGTKEKGDLSMDDI
jgi:NDP-sugar pyrophosphorylase family protein